MPLKSYLTASELGLPVVKKSELPALVARCPSVPLLHALSRLGVLGEVEGHTGRRLVDLALRHFAEPRLAEAIRLRLARDADAVILGPQTILAAMTLAAAFGSSDAATDSRPTDLLPLLLQVGAHLEPWAVLNCTARQKRLMCRYLFANGLMNERESHRDLFVRYFQLYGDAWKRACLAFPAKAESIETAFRHETGIDMSRFFDIATAITFLVEGEARQESQELPVTAVPFARMRETGVTSAEWSVLLNYLAQDSSRFADEARRVWGDESWAWDIFGVVNAPLLRNGDEALVVSLHFLARKATEGLLWITRRKDSKLDEGRFLRLRQTLGRAFEIYVRDLVQAACGDAAFDGHVAAGSAIAEVDSAAVLPPDLIVFEASARVPRRELWLVADDKLFDDYVDDAIVSKARQLQRLLRKLRSAPTATIHGHSVATLHTVWPVIVLLGSCPIEPKLVWPRIRHRIEEAGIRLEGDLERLMVMSVGDLESLVGVARRRPLIEVLRSKWASAEFRGESMHNYVALNLRREREDGYKALIEEPWQAMTRRMKRSLFGRE